MKFTYEIHEVKEFELDFDFIYNNISTHLETTDCAQIRDYFLDNLSDFIASAIPDDYQDEYNEYTELTVGDEWLRYIATNYEEDN